jgi:peptidoglycan/LPS O-acetylase OafA/YrhL
MPATSFFDKFQRITASTQYMPEIDGLRFIALFWVVTFMHSVHFLDVKFYNNRLVPEGFWKTVLFEGAHGMYLFFIISGFILSLPFAKTYFKGEPKVPWKRYLTRRLTRIEPPYIIALFIFFAAHLFIIQKFTLAQLLPSLGASLIYSHGFIFGQHSIILPVAWSLEVEVQFYLLAPIFCVLFKIKMVWLRRLILVAVILAGLFYMDHYVGAEGHRPYPHVFVYIHYFFSGLLLADLYVHHEAKPRASQLGLLLGVFALVGSFILPTHYRLPGIFIKLIFLFCLFYQTLFNSILKKALSVKIITVIGGMCYSAYLFHFGVLSAFDLIAKSVIDVSNLFMAPLFLLIVTFLILLCAGIFYFFVERPFMQWKVKVH